MDSETLKKIKRELSDAERRAVERHKYYLSEGAHHDVGFDFALEDWLQNHSDHWRSQRLREDLVRQSEEIRKHKWIESQKAGADLGQKAVEDWIKNYAAKWRRWREMAE